MFVLPEHVFTNTAKQDQDSCVANCNLFENENASFLTAELYSRN